jgi:peroxiredoxin
MNLLPDLEHEPVAFCATSNKIASLTNHHVSGTYPQVLNATDFRGRVPLVLTFVPFRNIDDRESTNVVRSLDASLHKFGDRRVQLLVVIASDPQLAAQHLKVNVPLISDPHLQSLLHATGADDGGVSSFIVATDGMLMDVTHQLPVSDQAAPLLATLDRWRQLLPDRFQSLPTGLLPLPSVGVTHTRS